MREPSLRETTKRWMALHLSVDGEGVDWMTKSKGAIKKANLTLTAKFLWLHVCHCLSPTAADNIVTWDRAVLMAVMIVGFDVDFACFYRQSCTRGHSRSLLPTLSHA